MNKTIFNLDYKKSVIIICILGIVLGFLSNAFYIDGLVDFIFYVVRSILFVGIYLVLYLIESNPKFKLIAKKMAGYLIISSLLNIVFSIFVVTHLLPQLFITFSGIVCFWLIACFTLEIIELFYNNKFINKFNKINEKLSLLIANPITKIIETRIRNKE